MEATEPKPEAGMLSKAKLRLAYSPPEPPTTQEKSLELTSGFLKVPQALATRHRWDGVGVRVAPWDSDSVISLLQAAGMRRRSSRQAPHQEPGRRGKNKGACGPQRESKKKKMNGESKTDQD